MGIQDYFDFVVTFSDTRKTKPHSLPFERAIKKLRLKPQEILFVGDQPQRDIKGAKAVGMITALAEYGLQKKYEKYLRQNKPDYMLKSIEDILKVV